MDKTISNIPCWLIRKGTCLCLKSHKHFLWYIQMSIPGWYSKYFHWFLDCRHPMTNFITEISTFVSKNLGNTEELFDWYKTTVIPISMPQNNSIFAKKCQKIFCHALQNVHLSNSPTSQVCKVGSPLAILAANFTLFESILWHERPILRPRGAKMFVPKSKAWKMKDFVGIDKQSRNSKFVNWKQNA